VSAGAADRIRQFRCRGCGASYRAAREGCSALVCPRCGTTLVRFNGRSVDAGLAVSAATLVLLVPANLLPFMETSLLGVSQTSWLVSSATAMWRDGWPWLALAIGAFVVVAPLVRFALLTVVLAAVRLEWRIVGLGRVFRIAQGLAPWAMPDVFLLGLWIAYSRLHAAMAVTLHAGAICLVAAGVLTLLTRALVPVEHVWSGILAEDEVLDRGAATCATCDMPSAVAAGRSPCRRCGARAGTPAGTSHCPAALTACGMVLYVVANLFPMATMPIGLTPSSYTVLQGALDLLHAGLYPLALLVFTVSFAVPLLKLAGLAWLVATVQSRSKRHLRFKTGLFHVVEEIGRWSMVDPYVIAAFVPVVRYNALIYGRADGAATAFTAVVVSTMIAARSFDPRRMWQSGSRPA
jgi:paraquat-inducible protein A